MSTQIPVAMKRPAPARAGLRLGVAIVAALVLLLAMALSTRVVKIGSAADVQPGAFVPAAFGASEFPKVREAIESRAVDAKTLADALAADQAAALKKYGTGDVLPVKFTGVVGKGDFGVYDVKVDGMPDGVTVRVQTGPAIMGTELRDATGTIQFGQFTNQIDYQNAGSALNKEMKKQVLAKADPANLSGKTIAVVGAFRLTDPKNWLVTPVALEVK